MHVVVCLLITARSGEQAWDHGAIDISSAHVSNHLIPAFNPPFVTPGAASGAFVGVSPFTHAHIPSLLGEAFLQQLQHESESIPFNMKSNDLYQFQQARACRHHRTVSSAVRRPPQH